MKSQIHPKYFDQAQVTCVCGNKFTVGSTHETISIELCPKCHPFYTGEQRFVDSDSRIEKFKKKQDAAKSYITKTEKKAEEKRRAENAPKSLREMLMGLK